MLSLTNSLLRAPPVPIQLQVCRWPLEIDVARGNLALFRYAGWSPHWASSTPGNPAIDANCLRGRRRIGV